MRALNASVRANRVLFHTFPSNLHFPSKFICALYEGGGRVVLLKPLAPFSLAHAGIQPERVSVQATKHDAKRKLMSLWPSNRIYQYFLFASRAFAQELRAYFRVFKRFSKFVSRLQSFLKWLKGSKVKYTFGSSSESSNKWKITEFPRIYKSSCVVLLYLLHFHETCNLPSLGNLHKSLIKVTNVSTINEFLLKLTSIIPNHLDTST